MPTILATDGRDDVAEVLGKMAVLAAKALIAPFLLGACTLVAWKWGTAAGGWLLGLPLISGPVSVILLLEHGARFAEGAARGTLLGMVAGGVFYSGYALAARGRRWWESLLLAGAACVATGLALSRVHLDLADTVLFAAVFLALMAFVTRAPRTAAAAPEPRVRDLLPRMALASAIVVGVTLASGVLGSQLSGMLTTVPVTTALMAAATHRASGGGSARRLLAGTLTGLWGAAAFFAVVGALVTDTTPAVTYLAATVASIAVALAAGRASRATRRV